MKSRGHAIAAALATMSVLAPSAALADTPPGSVQELQAGLDGILKAGAVGVIAEARLDGKVWRGSSGVVRRDRPGRPTGGERLRAGSIVKTFVATVVLQLVGEGKLRLDDTLARMLPRTVADDLVEAADKITLRQLLTHSSGVLEYLPEGEPPGGALAGRHRTWKPAELVALSRRYERPFKPGEKQVYSNTNYVLLGMIIRRATGHDFGAEIDRRVIRPLGLKDTEVPGADPAITGPHLHGYLPGKDGRPVDISRYNMTVASSAGNLISTDADLNRFFRALVTGKLLRPALLKQMMTGQEYGMGLGMTTGPCGKLVGHTGTAYGYQTMSFHSADGRRQISVSYTPLTSKELQAANAIVFKTLCPADDRKRS
ncbi:serine hydrolase domain-containing protein [Nonomuraea endophytica]|uniref:serine hydrolase domain-containing protein n=1 Tax=Nonomuraea endophytica TaxID=714136 RepID=UPI0037CBFD1E